MPSQQPTEEPMADAQNAEGDAAEDLPMRRGEVRIKMVSLIFSNMICKL